ncbi:hypothetical protein HK097_010306 [Rhizophlyctis rosea]|uniref:Uncharacterized protein n=1 Tax=Rhizophlyctis rosea TaxID=64517 RepID=A0AAD5S7Q7_9FUNG|nr:hypothetical protein HK097_010306 [Rhizophlyctis rosea]
MSPVTEDEQFLANAPRHLSEDRGFVPLASTDFGGVVRLGSTWLGCVPITEKRVKSAGPPRSLVSRANREQKDHEKQLYNRVIEAYRLLSVHAPELVNLAQSVGSIIKQQKHVESSFYIGASDNVHICISTHHTNSKVSDEVNLEFDARYNGDGLRAQCIGLYPDDDVDIDVNCIGDFRDEPIPRPLIPTVPNITSVPAVPPVPGDPKSGIGTSLGGAVVTGGLLEEGDIVYVIGFNQNPTEETLQQFAAYYLNQWHATLSLNDAFSALRPLTKVVSPGVVTKIEGTIAHVTCTLWFGSSGSPCFRISERGELELVGKVKAGASVMNRNLIQVFPSNLAELISSAIRADSAV